MVFPIRNERGYQLHLVDILRVLLFAAGRVWTAVCVGPVRGDYVLRARLDPHVHIGECESYITDIRP